MVKKVTSIKKFLQWIFIVQMDYIVTLSLENWKGFASIQGGQYKNTPLFVHQHIKRIWFILYLYTVTIFMQFNIAFKKSLSDMYATLWIMSFVMLITNNTKASVFPEMLDSNLYIRLIRLMLHSLYCVEDLNEK